MAAPGGSGPFLHQQQRPLPSPPPAAAKVAPSPPTAAVVAATSLTGGCGAFPTDVESDGFLCDANGMGIEGAVPVMQDAEALRAAQIYFVLPAAVRRRGLRHEVAALAVRASAALSSRAASAAAPGLPSLPSPADVGLELAWPIKNTVLSEPARHGKWPDGPCLGRRLGTVDWDNTARRPIVPYRARPGGPNGQLYLTL